MSFPFIAIHSGLSQEDRITRYKQFKEFQKCIMVASDLFGRGIGIERVSIVVNYNMPGDSDSYCTGGSLGSLRHEGPRDHVREQ